MNGQELKREGQQAALASSGDWKAETLSLLRMFCSARKKSGQPTFALEEFRQEVEGQGWPAPASLNAWGGLAQSAASDEIIKATDTVRMAARAKAHARLVRVWVAL